MKSLKNWWRSSRGDKVELVWDPAEHHWQVLNPFLDHVPLSRDLREALKMAKALAISEKTDLHIYSQEGKLEEVRAYSDLRGEEKKIKRAATHRAEWAAT